MGQCNALGTMMICLRPQNGFAVLSEPICRVIGYAVDPSAHSLQTAALRQPNQDGILNPESACLLRREQAVMLFGKCV